MNLKESKQYFPFLLSVILFVISLIYIALIYIKWDDSPENNGEAVEINLPIIEWEKYTGLSKQYEDATILKE